MKFVKNLVLVSCLMGTAGAAMAATPTMTWNIASDQKIDQLTFGITINAAAPRDQFYFANQFGFSDGGAIGYTGIQPTVNTADGKRQFKVLFSSFRADSVSTFENCSSGADGASAGVTCRMLVPGELGDTFIFNVKKEDGLMTGTVTNQTTGRMDIIGQWTVDKSVDALKASESSWIENYRMNDPRYGLTCDKVSWPYYEVKFLPPTGNNGALKGTISGLNRGSDTCPGAITWTTDSTGTLVKGGFK